jgi:hypothetical protein
MTSDTRSPKQIAVDVREKIAFLKYVSDFLDQLAKRSCGLGLKQTHYFVSMAAIDASENLVQLQHQLKLLSVSGAI